MALNDRKEWHGNKENGNGAEVLSGSETWKQVGILGQMTALANVVLALTELSFALIAARLQETHSFVVSLNISLHRSCSGLLLFSVPGTELFIWSETESRRWFSSRPLWSHRIAGSAPGSEAE